MPSKPFIERIYDALRNYVIQPVSPIHLYQVGAGILLIWLLATPILSLDIIPSMLLMGTGTIFISFGFCWEVFIKLKEMLKNNIISTIIIALPSGVIISTISVVISEQLINKAMSLKPDYFDNGVRLIAALFTPIVLAYMVAIWLLVYYIYVMTKDSLRSPYVFMRALLLRQKGNPVNIKSVARGAAAVLLSLQITQTMAFLSVKAEPHLTKATQLVLVLTDYYSYGPCINVKPNERYAFLDNNEISVINIEKELRFDSRQCVKNSPKQTSKTKPIAPAKPFTRTDSHASI